MRAASRQPIDHNWLRPVLCSCRCSVHLPDVGLVPLPSDGESRTDGQNSKHKFIFAIVMVRMASFVS